MPHPLPLAGEIPLYDDATLDEDLRTVGRNKLAERITGGLSFTSKMPCPSWGVPARRCKIGSVLAQKEGTTCSGCYALKGRYLFGNVQKRLEERYNGLFDVRWTPAMIYLVRYYCGEYFRMFDSGDFQSETHALNVNTIARHVPDVKIWCPSRELEVIRAVRKRIGEFAPNLVIRASAAMIDGKPPKGFSTTSTVVSDPEEATCPAPDQGGRCGECRHCWDPAISNIAYLRH